MPENPAPQATQTQASKAAKKPKPIDIFLTLSAQDLLNLFNQKTVTQTKGGIAFAFSLGEFDSGDISILESANESFEDIVNDLIDEDDGDDDSTEFDDDAEDEEEPEVPEEE